MKPEKMLLILGIPINWVSTWSDETFTQFTGNIDTAGLQALFLETFYNSIKTSLKKKTAEATQLTEAIKKDENRFIEILALHANDYNTLVNGLKNNTYIPAISAGVAAHLFSGDEKTKLKQTEALAPLFSHCLIQYGFRFLKEMIEKQGLQFGLALQAVSSEQILEILDKKTHPELLKGIALILHQIGSIYQKENHLDDALKQTEKSMNVFKEIVENDADKARTLSQVGMIYEAQGRNEDALQKYEQSLDMLKKSGDVSGTAFSLGQLGQFLLKMNRLEDALKYFIEAFKVFMELKSPYADLAKQDIAKIHKKMPQVRYEEIVKSYNLTPDDLVATEQPQPKDPMEFFVQVTNQSLEAKGKNTEESKTLLTILNTLVEKLKEDTPQANGMKNFFRMLAAYVTDADYEAYIPSVPNELYTIFESHRRKKEKKNK